VQRTIRNSDFCNAARTNAGIVLSQFGHVAGGPAQNAKKIAAFAGGLSPGRKRPQTKKMGRCGVPGVPSQHMICMALFAADSKLIVHRKRKSNTHCCLTASYAGWNSVSKR
jgi:hypothetical protein